MWLLSGHITSFRQKAECPGDLGITWVILHGASDYGVVGWVGGDGLSAPPVFSIINLKQRDCFVETKNLRFFSTDCICGGRTWKEVTERWRKLRDEKLHNLYFSPYIILVIKETGMCEICSF